MNCTGWCSSYRLVGVSLQWVGVAITLVGVSLPLIGAAATALIGAAVLLVGAGSSYSSENETSLFLHLFMYLTL